VVAAGCRRGPLETEDWCGLPCASVYSTADRPLSPVACKDRQVSAPADLGVEDAAGALAARVLSSRELVDACLARIAERDGTHSTDGDPNSVNAWVRVYEEDARAAAAQADERLAHGDAPALCGIPIGLKDLYAVAGKPLTASSRVLDEVPERDCDAWARLSAAGMVLLGHLHTHEFACGGTTDQVGNPWALERSAGGSSGGSGAALASGQVPAATGTDTAGSLRIPSSDCGTSTIKPTLGLLSLRGIVPLAPSFDHPGPMTRTVRDCEPLLAALAGIEPPTERRPLRRYVVSPRIADLDPDVADGFERALAALSAERVEPPPLAARLDVVAEFFDLVLTEMLVWHRRFDDRRDQYRYSNRARLEHADQRAMTAEEYVASQVGRAEDTYTWRDWLAEHRIDAIVEPTLPIVAPLRGRGYEESFGDLDDLSLTYYWDWTGFPVVALPSGVGSRSGLPVSVSLIGAPGSDWDLLAWGSALQDELGTVSP
jgi:aspartyl-tRNA(Asn)/glutamyl-tRNA(Gln) amidotransferase subunit A